jgi:hypothetical protein
MPSSATITALYTFTPYTKARAVQINADFSNLRGHMLPLDPTATSASDQNYDLGSSEYRWRNAFLSTISLSISTGDSQVLSGTTAGGFKFVNGATTTFSLLGTDFQGLNATPMTPTTSAGLGGFAWSAPINVTLTADGAVTGSTCTLSTNGRPVLLGLMNVTDTAGSSGLILRELTIGGVTVSIGMHLKFMLSGATVGAVFTGSGRSGIGSLGWPDSYNYSPVGALQLIYFPAAGTYNLSLEVAADANSYTNIGFTLENVRMFAYELP